MTSKYERLEDQFAAIIEAFERRLDARFEALAGTFTYLLKMYIDIV